jgi:hypothetical protein
MKTLKPLHKSSFWPQFVSHVDIRQLQFVVAFPQGEMFNNARGCHKNRSFWNKLELQNLDRFYVSYTKQEKTIYCYGYCVNYSSQNR